MSAPEVPAAPAAHRKLLQVADRIGSRAWRQRQRQILNPRKQTPPAAEPQGSPDAAKPDAGAKPDQEQADRQKPGAAPAAEPGVDNRAWKNLPPVLAVERVNGRERAVVPKPAEAGRDYRFLANQARDYSYLQKGWGTSRVADAFWGHN